MPRHVVPLLVVSVAALAVWGCSRPPATPSAVKNAAAPPPSIDGMRFVSTELWEVGLQPNGEEALGRWRLSFAGGAVTWDCSDYQQSGKYTLAPDGSITAYLGAQEVAGSFDPQTGTLTWDGKQYRPAADGE